MRDTTPETQKDPFAVGVHRPVYLWGGPGTVRMNQLKFMGAPVDEAVHAEAHTRVGADRMAREAGFSWAYLMYNWGFPPEIEQEDRDDFCRAVEAYQAAGIKVFGYVQASNCVYDGSYLDKDWYALDPRGRPFHYYTGRYMTCWTDPQWLDHLRNVVQGIVASGAEGVYFDNPWHGIQPLTFGGAWMGPAGCYCDRCRTAFRKASGLEMPIEISPESDPSSQQYLRWRAGQVAGTLRMLSDHARSLNPEVLIGANDFDAVMRPSYAIVGIDLDLLATVQDVVVIEDYGLPRWSRDTGDATPLLVNNALTLRTARALIGDRPLSTIPYDKGIGFDGVYAPRRFRQGIAEAAACGASAVVKGTEFVQDGTFTLLTAEQFGPQREATGEIHHWLAEHAGLYQGRTNAAAVALLHPGEKLWQEWNRLAGLYFGAGQTLLQAGIPWRVVRAGDDLSGLDALLCLGDGPEGDSVPPGLQVVDVPRLSGWAPARPSFLARHETARKWASRVVGWLFQSYFRHRLTRQSVDGLGLVHFFWQTPYFRVPPADMRQALLEALACKPHPRVEADAPVLAEVWQRGETRQLHLVNYAGEPQAIRVTFGQPVTGRGISPDRTSPLATEFRGATLEGTLDVYTVLEYVIE